MLAAFQGLISSKYPWKLKELLPRALLTGEDAGALNKDGARLLDPSGGQTGNPRPPSRWGLRHASCGRRRDTAFHHLRLIFHDDRFSRNGIAGKHGQPFYLIQIGNDAGGDSIVARLPDLDQIHLHEQVARGNMLARLHVAGKPLPLQFDGIQPEMDQNFKAVVALQADCMQRIGDLHHSPGDRSQHLVSGSRLQRAK